MTEVASAYVTLLPSARGFGRGIDRAIGGDMDRSGRRAGRRFGGAMSTGLRGMATRVFAPLLGAAGIGALIKGAVNLEAQFSQTLNTIGAVANVSGAQLQELTDLALQLGADTSFSANEAAEAMLELAKGGLSAATIQAGALAGTLQLAAAGGTSMGVAATIASNAMNAFSLKGEDMAAVAAALAGGANASSASVESLGQALSQVGPGAVNAGLDLQETIAALSAFDAAGIKGSDAGTSLKTMLARLVPMTNKARKAMENFGLDFIQEDGSFESLTNIAGQLQKQLGGLSEEQRSVALQTIFGSDAARAAAVLMKEGASGIREYIAATKDQGAAQRAADARMAGTAGAIEQLQGAIETARIQLGKFIQPTVVAGLGLLTDTVNGIVSAIGNIGSANLGSLFSGGGGGASFLSSLSDAGNAAVDFVRGLLPTLRRIGTDLLGAIGPGLQQIGDAIAKDLLPAFQRLLPVIAPVAKFLLRLFGDALVGAIKGVVKVIVGVVDVIAGLFNLVSSLVKGDWSAAWDAIGQIASGALTAFIGFIQAWWNGGILAIFRRGIFFLTKGLWVGLWKNLRSAASSGFSALNGLVSLGLRAIGSAFLAGVKGYVGIWRNIFKLLRDVAVAGWKALRSAFGGAVAAIRTMVSEFVGGLLRLFTGAVTAYVRAWTGIWKAILGAVRTGAREVVTFVREIPGRILRAVGDLSKLLFTKGQDLIKGLIEGITSKIEDIGGAMKGVAGKIAGFLPGSPVREGPLTTWNRGGAGKRLMELLASGLESSPVESAMTKALRPISSPQAAPLRGVELQSAPAGASTAGRIAPLMDNVSIRVNDGREIERWARQKAIMADGGGVVF